MGPNWLGTLLMGERATRLQEYMDDPACDRDRLYRTYRHLRQLNAVVSGWGRCYRKLIRPELTDRHRTYRLLDIGFGGGDVPWRLLRWAARDGFRLAVTAIDPDPRALEFVARQVWPPAMQFRHAAACELRARQERFDFVVSNHVLHHLRPDEVRRLCEDADALCTRLVVFNDLARQAVVGALYALVARVVFHGSFAAVDGYRSIRRSFTAAELRGLVPRPWAVRHSFPNRLLAWHRK